MNKLLSISLLALGCVAASAQTLAGPGDMAPGPTAVPQKPVSFDVSAIDKSADPCVNFYQYACGNWMKKNPIPADQVRWGRFNELAEYNNYSLYQDLEKAATDPSSPLEKKYGNFFASCMDVDQVDKMGAKPLQPELDAIDSLSSGKNLAELNIELSKRFGGPQLLGVGVLQDQKNSSEQILGTFQGGLTLPDRSYYIEQDARNQKIRTEYVANMTKTFELLGDSAEKASKEADDVLRIETALAKASMDRVEMRDPAKRYHIMTIAEVQQLAPDYKWKQYLNGIDMSQVSTMDVMSPEYIKAVNEELTSEPLPAIKAYLRWHAVHAASTYLSKPFVDADFDFFARTLEGQKEQRPRWKRCTALTNRELGEAVGQDWVKQHFPPQDKASMEKLVHELEKALGEDIQQLPWMSPETKAQAELKLKAIRDKIGYPSHWRDYSKLEISRDNLLANVEHGAVFERNRDLAKYGKPVDETEWGMTPPTVNAYYNPPQNDINFPAGILQPPFYDPSKDAAINFGGIGVVIGHEMTHGFDDQGSKYDLHGNVRVWWTPEDLAKFKERTECEAKEYSGFEVAPGQNLNGHLTLGENTADNGGLRIAFQALMNTLAEQGKQGDDAKYEGYTPAQQFFISFGQVWCQNQTEQSARVSAKVDPHSSGEWRTNGTVQNFDAFGKAFGCHKGQPMMPASGGCRVW